MSKKKSVDKKISEALNLTPQEESEETAIEPRKPIEIEVSEVNKVNKDYADVRTNLKGLIQQGNEALEGILEVAHEGESPRAYEVAAILIKQLADVNKDLIDTHKKIKDIRKVEGDQHAKSITNNAIYFGSTSDLQNYLKERSKNPEMIEGEIIDHDGQET